MQSHLTNGKLVLGAFCLLFVAASPAPHESADDSTELRLLFLLWRHGDRSPITTYPKDPFKDYPYPPYGEGNLIEEGYVREYNLGRFLRERYGSFLGEEVTPNLMQLRSSMYPRTQESGALVMAGMFPPAPSQRWGPGLGQLWRPFVFSETPYGLLYGSSPGCPGFMEEGVANLEAVGETRSINNATFMAYMAENTGFPVGDVVSVYNVLDVLNAQDVYGLELPEWTKGIYPELYDDSMQHITAAWETERAKRLSGGRFLYDILTTSLSFKNGELPEGRRLYGFSGHDLSLFAALAVLELPNHGRPPFGTVLMIELHEEKSTGELGFKFFLRNDTSVPPYELPVGGCGLFCPLDKFVDLVGKRAIPTEAQWIQECHASADDQEWEGIFTPNLV